MNVLFNCSIIKRVHLRLESSPIELEIVYTDEQGTWMVRKSIDSKCDKEYHKQRYERAYNVIKAALLNKEPFAEIEI